MDEHSERRESARMLKVQAMSRAPLRHGGRRVVLPPIVPSAEEQQVFRTRLSMPRPSMGSRTHHGQMAEWIV